MTAPARSRPEVGLFTARVVAASAVTPRMRRITLAGPDLGGFAGDRPADAVKLVLPRGGLGAPPRVGWGPAGLDLDDPADLRAYTVRRFDRAAGLLDIDVVLHGHGPGATWAAHAAPGDPVAFLGPRRDYPDAEPPDLLLVVGDETAVPAAAGMVESLRPGQRAQVFLEVADAADEVPMGSPGEVTLSWLHRGAAKGSALADAVRAFRLPPGRVRAWVAAETGAALAVRKVLRAEFGLPRAAVSAFGYWQRDRVAEEAEDVPEEQR